MTRFSAMLSRLIAYDSPFRRHAKVWFADLRALARLGSNWQRLANEPPRGMCIETTNVCNADCVFCAYRYQKNFRPDTGVMDDAIFERALTGYRDLGGQHLSFTPLVGEPLIDPNLLPRLEKACSFGFDVSFHTNGILLHRIDLARFVSTGIREIVLSVAPFSSESHELLYQTPHYDKLLEGILALLETRNTHGQNVKITFHFRSHMSIKDMLELPDFNQRILPLMNYRDSWQALITGFDTWGRQIAPQELPGKMRMAFPPRVKRRPCNLTFTPQILWNGKVRACPCFFGPAECDELQIGDLKQTTLPEIWRGEALKQLRRRFITRDLPELCKTCTSYMAP